MLNYPFLGAGEQVFIIIVLVILSLVISGVKKALEKGQQPPPKRRPPPGGGAGPAAPGMPQKQPGDQELRDFLKNLAQGRPLPVAPPKPADSRPSRPAPKWAEADELAGHKHETVAEHAREVSERKFQQLEIDEDVLRPLSERKPLVEAAPKKAEDPYRFKARPKKAKAAPKPTRRAQAEAKAAAAARSPAMARRAKAAPIAQGEVGLIENLSEELSPMQRAIALTEILGIPPALREGGGYPMI